MKKILNIIAQRPDKTGSGIYLQSLVKEGDKKGYDQAVVAGITIKDKKVIFDTKKTVKFYPVYFESEELTFPIVGMSDVMPYKSTRYRDLSIGMMEQWKKVFSIAIKKAVEEFKPDVIVCHHLWLLTGLVKEMCPKENIISFCHGTDLRQLQFFKNIDDNFSKELTSYVIDNCKKLEKVVVSHNAEKEMVIREYGISENNIKIAGTGFNPKIFYMKKNKVSKENRRIVYAGKLSYSKGVPFLINALKKICKYEDNIELYLVGSGSGEEAEHIISSCKDKLYNFKIHILGAVSQKKLGDIFRECHIFVLPSLYEGLPLVPIEAMACGLKVVITDLPGVKEWMGDDINNSGIIEYVDLPRLINIDTIVEEDIAEFEENLSKAIKNQIDNNSAVTEELKASIGTKSWKSAFEAIEKLF